jgi:putative phosphoesterase
MKILVFSDSHGRFHGMRRALLMHPDAEVVFFLGDGVSDLGDLTEELSGRAVIAVKGNNDWSSPYPISQEITLDGKKIFLTHGHAYQAKYGTETLFQAAQSRGASLVCFGHTHQPLSVYQDGIYLFNPGSVTYSGTYGLIDLVPSGIMTSIANL